MPMSSKRFVEEYAKLADVSTERATNLIAMFRALVVAGVHAETTVTVHNFGTFSHKWWIPKGQLADKGWLPKNRLLFKPSALVVGRMTDWTGCPGHGLKDRKRAKREQARKRAARSVEQSPGAAHDPVKRPVASAD